MYIHCLYPASRTHNYYDCTFIVTLHSLKFVTLDGFVVSTLLHVDFNSPMEQR